MATCLARFEFHCAKAPEKLKFIHNIPRSLVIADAQAAQDDPGYVNSFVSVLQPITEEHEAACRAASNPLCGNCGSHTAKILYTPMSWLHTVEDPFVSIWVDPVCGKGECEIRTRQQIQGMMSTIVQENQSERVSAPRAPMEIMPCKICGKTEATKRCARCQVVAYCGKEHQKADWKVHKQICTSNVRTAPPTGGTQ
ncbi:hypothetical protein B0J12DRAFT_393208 [Macrophomina phaseolina]|uniref:MYND-type domain-containing protein n=1 Tax=Macrophomina phaseolina TaxID=35725 RepID=A0ABQ8FV43_9PEZI|nr:hypothetical protein B0J12DRAFT_393208 [Macrophomina phaseolina]